MSPSAIERRSPAAGVLRGFAPFGAGSPRGSVAGDASDFLTVTARGGLFKVSVKQPRVIDRLDIHDKRERAIAEAWSRHVAEVGRVYRRDPDDDSLAGVDVVTDGDRLLGLGGDIAPDIEASRLAGRARVDLRRRAARGRVSGFSARSRKRLLESIAQFNPKVRGLFITFTYRVAPASHAEAKRHLDLMLRWLKYHYDNPPALWRMEYQARGVVHFHVLVFGLGRVQLYDSKTAPGITDHWKRVTGDDSYPDVKTFRNRRKAMFYAAKYAAKASAPDAVAVAPDAVGGGAGLDNLPYSENESGPDQFVGRFWGFVARSKLPWADGLVNVQLGWVWASAFVELRRYARRRYRGIRGSAPVGFSLFVLDDWKRGRYGAQRWLELWDSIFSDHHNLDAPAVGIGAPSQYASDYLTFIKRAERVRRSA